MSNQIDDIKSFNAPHVIYFKSIVLSRMEAKFLGYDIMTNLSDAVWMKFGNTELQVFLYYIFYKIINKL